MASSGITAHPIEQEQIASIVALALAEDGGDPPCDVTAESTIPADAAGRAVFLAKAEGVLAGTDVADAVFRAVGGGCSVQWSVANGAFVRPGMEVGIATGNARALLRGERVALNLMQRMSGVATATWRMQDKCKPYAARVLDTRKTTPGLRHLDKYAVRIGGGENHRIGLYDMVLIKDNHVDVAGGVREALASTTKHLKSKGLVGKVKVELETRNLDEVKLALECKSDGLLLDRVMLDNFAVFSADTKTTDVSRLKEAVEFIAGRVKTEASGGINMDSIHDVASSGVDYISSGALTHSVIALDISMKIKIE